jgi:hypothetical protein
MRQHGVVGPKETNRVQGRVEPPEPAGGQGRIGPADPVVFIARMLKTVGLATERG